MAAFQCLQPFVGTLLAFLFLNERPTVWDLGGFGVLTGLVVVVRDASAREGGLKGRGDGLSPPPVNATKSSPHKLPRSTRLV